MFGWTGQRSAMQVRTSQRRSVRTCLADLVRSPPRTQVYVGLLGDHPQWRLAHFACAMKPPLLTRAPKLMQEFGALMRTGPA